MTRCPLTHESVPRTRRRPLVNVRPAQGERLTPAQARGDEQAQQWRIRDLGNGEVVPSCPRHTSGLTLAAGLLAGSSSRTVVSSSLWPRWASPERRSANYARSSGSQADLY